jgi:negative regulator of flagellin synthesis FlgM
MKISNQNPIIQHDIHTQRIQKNEEVKAQQSQTSSPDKVYNGERVELSQRAKDIQKIKKIVEETPEIREDKVTDLKQKIEQGIYNVKGEKVAQKLLEDLILDFLS